MELLEKVERLREKTGVSYQEAKAALEETGGDLLEALCWLEQNGKIKEGAAFCSTEFRAEPEPETTEIPHEKKSKEPGSFERGMHALWEGFLSLLRAGNRNSLILTDRSGEQKLTMSVTLFVVLAILFFWAMTVLVVIALFFGYRFSFRGPELGKDPINDAVGKATDYAESIKQEFSDRK